MSYSSSTSCKMAKHFLVLFSYFAVLFYSINGHGMMLDPPGRSSLWRFFSNATINYQDNENFCGGFDVQFERNGGKCGVCGDSATDPHPQKNENTGLYGVGLVTKTYQKGSTITTNSLLTANHIGKISYSLCILDNPNAPESGEECFQDLLLADGSKAYQVSKTDYSVTNQVVLPKDVTCARCVLRWHYTAGNNWGNCDDGTHKMGCGPQETFRSCADVAIV